MEKLTFNINYLLWCFSLIVQYVMSFFQLKHKKMFAKFEIGLPFQQN